MAVELATAYVNLVPSAKGIGASIARELAPIEGAAALTGKRAGGQLAGGVAGSFGSKISKFAKAATLPLVGIGVAAVASAKGLEDAQNTILRTTGATGKAASGLEASFKRVAASTPASFATIAETMATLSQRTGLTGKNLEDLTLQVVTFNRITKDAPVNVRDLTGTLAAFNIPGAKMGEVLDRLFVTSQKTGVPLTDLVSTLQKAGPTVRQFGFPIETAAGLLSTLNKAGVEAGPTVFALRSAFTKFAKAGKEPKAALQEVIGQIGQLVKAGDVAGARKLGVELFGARGVGLVDAAISGKLSLDSLTKSFDSTGKGIQATAKATSTVSGKLGLLKNNAQLALAELGTPVIDIANTALKGMIPTLKGITKGFASLPKPVQQFSVGLIAVGAAVGPLSKVSKGLKSLFIGAEGAATPLGKLALFIGRFAKSAVLAAAGALRTAAAFVAEKAAMVASAVATKALAVAQAILNAVMDANPIVLVIAAIVAIGAAIFIAYKKFKPFRDVVDAVGRALAKAFDFIKRNWKLILGLLVAPFVVLPILIVKNFDKIKTFLAGFAGVLGRFGLSLLQALGRGLAAGLPIVLKFWLTLPFRILGLLTRLAVLLIPKGIAIVVGLQIGFLRAQVRIGRFFLSLPGKILRFLGNVVPVLIGKGKDFIRGLILGFIAFEIKIAKFYASLPGKIIGFIGNVGKILFNKGIAILRGLRDGAAAFIPAVFRFFAGLPGRIIDELGDVTQWLFDVGKNVLKGLLNGIKDGLTSIPGFVKDTVVGSVVDAFKSGFGLFSPSKVMAKEIGGPLIEGVVVGMTLKARTLRPAVNAAVTSATTGIMIPALRTPNVGNVTVPGSSSTAAGDRKIADTIVINHVKDNDDAVRKLTWAAKTRGR